jgi:two-component system, chemotaxis family, CheB/CheR fusion protein
MVGSPPRALCVLIVDDCPDTSRTWALLVEAWGHVAHVAHTGPEALRQAAGLCPNVVLLDIGLPGMDGWQVARQMRTQPQMVGALLIAVSGYGQEEDRRRSQEAGCDMHLLKPVEPALLQNILQFQRKGD